VRDRFGPLMRILKRIASPANRVNDVFCGSKAFLGGSVRDWPAKLVEVRKGRVIRPLQSWFNADLVVIGEPQLLLTAEVMFGRLDGHVTEEELNLVELAACQMAKTRTCPSQIVRREFVYAGSLGRSLDDPPKHLRRHALAPNLS
jgi:hypothetical protein